MNSIYTTGLKVLKFWLRGSFGEAAKHPHSTNSDYEGTQQDWPDYTGINLKIKSMQGFIEWTDFTDIKHLDLLDNNFYSNK